jgi:SpoVK/Ycf46/Vps4 family AAA+-type ATPase
MAHVSSVIDALYAAVDASPGDSALRLHLARLLLDEGRAEDALLQAEEVLRASPADREALSVGADAAEQADLGERAAGYRRLLAALQSQRPSPEVGPLGSDSDAAENVPEPLKLFAVAGMGSGEVEVERPRIRLEDVAGMHEVKRRLRTAFLAPLENPALRRMYGKSLRGGLLLYGPPGCGKTFIARAVAGELGAKFISVGLHEVLDMYLGESERKLHELFENARREAPCVLFFDEVDAIGRRRTQLRHSAGRDVIVQFLSELDSFGSDNEGVFMLAATNHPWDVDSALRRPGRLDRTLLVLPPDRDARKEILALNLRDRPTADIDLDRLAEMTERFSGADLAHLCESAVEFALEDSIESGVPRPITTADLERALGELTPSTTAWLHTARNFAEFSNEGGVYDDLLRYLREQRLG